MLKKLRLRQKKWFSYKKTAAQQLFGKLLGEPAGLLNSTVDGLQGSFQIFLKQLSKVQKAFLKNFKC